MMDWGYGGSGAGDWVAVCVLMILFLGALTALAVWVVRSVQHDRPREHDPMGRADGLLAERFARGEIDGDEFSRSRDLLLSVGTAVDHSSRSSTSRPT